MKKTILLATIVLVFGVRQTNAQVAFGIKGGLNISNLSAKEDGTKVKLYSKQGVHIGAMVILPVSNSVNIEPAVMYSNKGAKGDDKDLNINLYSNESIKINYLEVPINVSYNINLSSTDKIKPFVFAGPYLGYAFSGKLKTGNTTINLKIGDSNNDDFKPLDYGANIGAGVRFSNFQISTQYGIGLANLEPGASTVKIKNGVFGLSIGYRFGSN